VILRGGTRAGKTYNTLIYLLRLALQEGKDVGIVGAHLVRLRETALRDFEEIVKRPAPDRLQSQSFGLHFPKRGADKSFFGADKRHKAAWGEAGYSIHQ